MRRDSPELILPPVTIERNENERCLVESSINSARISVKVKQADELEEILCRQFMRFLTQRAEAFKVLRRVPVVGVTTHDAIKTRQTTCTNNIKIQKKKKHPQHPPGKNMTEWQR